MARPVSATEVSQRGPKLTNTVRFYLPASETGNSPLNTPTSSRLRPTAGQERIAPNCDELEPVTNVRNIRVRPPVRITKVGAVIKIFGSIANTRCEPTQSDNEGGSVTEIDETPIESYIMEIPKPTNAPIQGSSFGAMPTNLKGIV